jgi:hypothetical protein
VARAIAARRQRIPRSEAILKIKRLIAGIMLGLVLMQFALNIGLWIATFILPIEFLLLVAAGTLGSTILAVILYTLAFWSVQHNQSRVKEAWQRYGGGIKPFFSGGYWNEYWEINTPFAPRWLGKMSFGLNLLFVVFCFSQAGLLITRLLEQSYSSASANIAVRTPIFLSLVWSFMVLPYVVSKWRELSQAAASASPEVRPS